MRFLSHLLRERLMLLCSETSVIRFYKYHQLPAAVHRAGGQCTVRDISTQQKI